jgi:hypothetical protein
MASYGDVPCDDESDDSTRRAWDGWNSSKDWLYRYGRDVFGLCGRVRTIDVGLSATDSRDEIVIECRRMDRAPSVQDEYVVVLSPARNMRYKSDKICFLLESPAGTSEGTWYEYYVHRTIALLSENKMRYDMCSAADWCQSMEESDDRLFQLCCTVLTQTLFFSTSKRRCGTNLFI